MNPTPHRPAHPLFSRDARADDTVVRVGAARFGGAHVGVIAGPCAVESAARLFADADALEERGVQVLRAGAFKPRTSPYDFRGLGEAGLLMLAEARTRTGIAICTEVLAVDDVELVARHADLLQVGTRNMQNFPLLEALGRQDRPVLLKRGMASTIDELLSAAEYVLAAGNPNVILCERGVRGFEPRTRAMFDLNAVAVLRQLTHLPVIADPSHATGIASLVPAVAIGAVAAGASGVIIEASCDPAGAEVDGAQTIDMGTLEDVLDGLQCVAAVSGRTLGLSLPHSDADTARVMYGAGAA